MSLISSSINNVMIRTEKPRAYGDLVEIVDRTSFDGMIINFNQLEYLPVITTRIKLIVLQELPAIGDTVQFDEKFKPLRGTVTHKAYGHGSKVILEVEIPMSDEEPIITTVTYDSSQSWYTMPRCHVIGK